MITWDDSTTAIKLTQMQLMEGLAAPVPRPRVHLTRYHGVLGPHYKHRKQIVPLQKMIPQLALVGGAADDKPAPQYTKRMSWAWLLKRVLNIDMTVFQKCQGKIRLIAAIEDPTR